MKKIAIIPARAGSKGLPNKNVLMLEDKPLMAYTIEAALESKEFDRVIVSTDSLEYKYIAEKFGAEVLMRDAELASDTASSFVVIEDILKKITNIDYFVLLQVTSPFRNYNHIRESIDLFEKNYSKYDFLVSVQKSDKPSFLIKTIGEDGSLKEYNMNLSDYTRQKYKEYHPNGAIFIGKVKEYLLQKHFLGDKSLAYFMNKEDSIDIDDILDFEFASNILKKKNKEKNLSKSIEKKISEKKNILNLEKDITLIGGTIFENWDIKTLGTKTVNNLGIEGITINQCKKLICELLEVGHLSKEIVIMLDINNIISKISKEQILQEINEITKNILSKNEKTKIYFMEIPSVIFRVDVKKEEIFSLNEYLKNNLDELIKYIELNKEMVDEFKNLKLDYTYDGYHLNEVGYKKMKTIIEKEI
ncbi:cytidylyltransferase domain-containing protein [Fusobacterium periodonticum]|jgi:N-acylneuraminate cytidylyltransferase|uniref:N-acylneuraminate cytidylyltransferase n=1 Tax=Fusobacterium periodonticum 1_1_41FAA TaxID=469621 RepID=D6LHY5_9FUSO|nr:GDSL-type esterase/lipase family protein [Fusobacterium periodonticum]EFG28011.1 cytidylyltransferase [Fusobacterium periodonticum 1_1_41FAA]